MPKNDNINTAPDKTNCQAGTLKGILASMTIGDENGTIDAQKASAECGSCTTLSMMNKDKMIGIVIGNVKVCDWVSSSDREPTAANSVE